MAIWTGQVQGKDLEEEEQQLDFMQETVMCSGSLSSFKTTLCISVMQSGLLTGRMYSG